MKTDPERNTRTLAIYTFLAFAFSWALAIPLALANLEILPEILSAWTHYLIPVGPALSALIVTAAFDGMSGLINLGRRLLRWGCPKWWIVSFSPLILAFLLKLLLNPLTGSQLRLASLGSLNFLPPFGMWALLFWIFTFGLGQEIGWRGFALSRLQKNRTAISATMILALIWILWTLPQYFYFFDPSQVAILVVGLSAGSIFLTWLYNSSSNSLLMTSIWHGSFLFITASNTSAGLLSHLLVALIVAFSGLIVLLTNPKHLMSL